MIRNNDLFVGVMVDDHMSSELWCLGTVGKRSLLQHSLNFMDLRTGASSNTQHAAAIREHVSHGSRLGERS